MCVHLPVCFCFNFVVNAEHTLRLLLFFVVVTETLSSFSFLDLWAVYRLYMFVHEHLSQVYMWSCVIMFSLYSCYCYDRS